MTVGNVSFSCIIPNYQDIDKGTLIPKLACTIFVPVLTYSIILFTASVILTSVLITASVVVIVVAGGILVREHLRQMAAEKVKKEYYEEVAQKVGRTEANRQEMIAAVPSTDPTIVPNTLLMSSTSMFDDHGLRSTTLNDPFAEDP